MLEITSGVNMLWFWGGSGLRIVDCLVNPLMEERGEQTSYAPFKRTTIQFVMSLYSYQIFSLKSCFLIPVEVEGFNMQKNRQFIARNITVYKVNMTLAFMLSHH